MRRLKGFTLLELIIVIIVLGILVAMALPRFVRVAERGHVAQGKMFLDMARKSEAIYYAHNSEYTDAQANLTLEIPELGAAFAVPGNPDWTLVIATNAPLNTTFIATITRDIGQFVGQTITIDQDGVIGGDHDLR